jgi:hypothetical protein
VTECAANSSLPVPSPTLGRKGVGANDRPSALLKGRAAEMPDAAT